MFNASVDDSMVAAKQGGCAWQIQELSPVKRKKGNTTHTQKQPTHDDARKR